MKILNGFLGNELIQDNDGKIYFMDFLTNVLIELKQDMKGGKS